MSHDGGGQPSCTTVPFGKYVRRMLRAAVGMKKPEKKKKPKDPAATDSFDGGAPMMERISSFSGEAARKESVVRVVLKCGMVETYPGVVLACTVIRNHPPGLCLAHPDVFRNPHGAVVRPLEPLFPGQKFLLLPETTVIHLKQKIPESSMGAFADDDYADSSDASDDEQDHRDHTTPSSSEEDAAGGDADDVDGFMAGCSAREFYVANERWSECQFMKLVHGGLAVEPSENRQPERKSAKKAKKKKWKGKAKKKRRVGMAGPAGFRMPTTAPRKAWEPGLPSVVEAEEETSFSSPGHTPAPSDQARPEPVIE